jgi:putative transposase
VKISANGKRLLLAKIGDVKLVYRRPVEGTPKTATIRRTATGKWFATISYAWEPAPLPPTGQEVGIDVGLKTFATLSDGQEIANPRFFHTEEKAVGRAQGKHQAALEVHKTICADVAARIKQKQPNLSEAEVWQAVSQDEGEQTAWQEHARRRKVVARAHERVRWKRENFAHQHTRWIVNTYDVIAVEDLSVAHLIQHERRAKSIYDVAWSRFTALIACKAAWADRRFFAVNPAYTSQERSGCGQGKADLTLLDRTYRCAACGLVIDRDLNAALSVLAMGRHGLASAEKPWINPWESSPIQPAQKIASEPPVMIYSAMAFFERSIP